MHDEQIVPGNLLIAMVGLPREDWSTVMAALMLFRDDLTDVGNKYARVLRTAQDVVAKERFLVHELVHHIEMMVCDKTPTKPINTYECYVIIRHALYRLHTQLVSASDEFSTLLRAAEVAAKADADDVWRIADVFHHACTSKEIK